MSTDRKAHLDAAVLALEELIREDPPVDDDVISAARHVVSCVVLGKRPEAWSQATLMKYAAKRQRVDRYGK